MVLTIYIDQTKGKCVLELGENNNKFKKENSKVSECQQEAASMDTLKHLGLIVQEG